VIRSAACLFLALWLALPVAALEPDRRDVTVIHARVWEGDTYREVFVPSTQPAMTLISGAASALTLVETLEYYWPLSRQVYVDFEARRVPVDAALSILADGVTVAEISQEPWSIVFPEGAIRGRAEILWGEAAIAEYQRHREDEATFNRRMAEAQRAHRAFERRLLEDGSQRAAGAPPEVIPPPPPLPEPSLRLVTPPQPGFRVDLPPGRYDIVFSRDGRALQGIARTLDVVDGTAPLAVVADVVPQERWTRPIPSNTDRARIYARPGASVFLTLSQAAQMDEARYLAATAPQAPVVPGRSLWVRRGEAGIQSLNLAWDAGPAATDIALTAFRVEQTRGSGFGYRIRAAETGETPELHAFAVSVPADRAVTRGQITAEDSGFSRDIVIVHPRDARIGFGLALVPIAGFLALRAWRWRQARTQATQG
jgi:hypothetical protein